MTAGTWTFTNAGLGYLIDGTTAIPSDSYKLALFTSASNLGASSTTYTGLTGEVSSTDTGYTTGGESIFITKSGTTVVTATFTSVTWTIGSAGLTAKWAVIYEVSGNILCYALLDSDGADITKVMDDILTISCNAHGLILFTVEYELTP